MKIATKQAVRISRNTTEPGFIHALRLSPEHLQEQDLKWKDDTLTVRYRIHPDVLWNNNSNAPSVSTYLALIDELTTQAVLAAKPKVLLAGVSVQLQAQLLTPIDDDALLDEVDILSTTTRMGRNLAFLGAQVVNPKDGTVYCQASHVKYLPTGNWIMDPILRNPNLFPLVQQVTKSWQLPNYTDNKESLQSVIEDHLTIDDDKPGYATFDVQKKHTNPFVTLHGGCQAILMERVGLELAADAIDDNDKVRLESQHIYYQTAGTGQVNVECRILQQTSSRIVMQAQILQAKSNKIVSEGTLQWEVL